VDDLAVFALRRSPIVPAFLAQKRLASLVEEQ